MQTKRRPNLFIVGAPKCGTSSFHKYLGAHPEIFMSEAKEPHYFGFDHHWINKPRLTEQQYLALFDAARDEKFVGEGSTSYLHSATAARELKEFSPDARILIFLRNPVEVSYALYATNLKHGLEFLPTFEEALEAEPERKQGKKLPTAIWGVQEFLFYRDFVRYASQVQRYLDVFGPDRVHIVLYDDLKVNTPAEYRKTLEFLGVRSDFQPDFEVANPNRSPRNLALNNFLCNPPRPLHALVRAALPKRLRQGALQKMKKANLKVEPRQSLDHELVQQLSVEFLPEMERLSKMLDRDVTPWCSKALVEAGQVSKA